MEKNEVKSLSAGIWRRIKVCCKLLSVYTGQLGVRTFKKELHLNLGTQVINFNLLNPHYHCLDFHSMKVGYDMSAYDGEDLILHWSLCCNWIVDRRRIYRLKDKLNFPVIKFTWAINLALTVMCLFMEVHGRIGWKSLLTNTARPLTRTLLRLLHISSK